MIADRRKHAFLVVAFGVAGAWPPASAAEFQCRHGDLLRRVEVNTGEAAQEAACEVRYWRDASSPAEGRVLWRANQDLDFCDAKARALLARLEAGGWACAASDLPGEPEGSQAAASSAPGEPPPSTPAPDAPSLQGSEPDAPAATAAGVKPPATAAVATAAPSAMAASQEPPGLGEEPAAAVAATVEPATPSGEPAPPAVARAESSAPAEQPAEPADSSNATLLERVVERTLQSVQQMYGGEFRAEDAAFGDLDGDGRDDAAVLVTYETEREDYVQYLVAYLFDGETFQSTATKNVGGRFLDALRAEVRGIVDRAIVVDLQALDAGEVCCETRRAAFVLSEGELVEVKDPAGAPRGPT